MRKIKTEIVSGSTLESLKKLNEQIFPILSVTEMTDNFYKNFTNSAGFAVLAFLDMKLVSTKIISKIVSKIFHLLGWSSLLSIS